jgi:hypothetical protein
VNLNSHLLVLRSDSATGMARVGWAVELPIGRFIHIDVICSSPVCAPILADDPLFPDYQTACHRARLHNAPLLEEQRRNNLANGWLPVPLTLHGSDTDPQPDDFGCYQLCAMQAMFRLSANERAVWAGISTDSITHIVPRRPLRPMQELEYHVWKHDILQRLSQRTEQVIRGELVVQASGLWFKPQREQGS